MSGAEIGSRAALSPSGVSRAARCEEGLLGEDAAPQATALMQRGAVVELSASLIISAAKTRLDLKLPMAGSSILVTAHLHNAQLWTQDEHFRDMGGVRFFPKGYKHDDLPSALRRVVAASRATVFRIKELY